MQNALVLGGSGFLGMHLVRRFRAAFPQMRCITTSRHPGAAGPARLWDACEPGASLRLLEELRPRVVILAAALARVGDCERDPALAQELNVALPAQLAALAKAHGTRLVHISSDLVFGGRPPLGERYSEADPPSPLGCYARTKAAGERPALQAGALVVRIPLLFGDSGGRGSGASDALFASLDRGESPGLFRDEWRTPLEVSSAAAALVELAMGEASGLLHLAGEQRLSRYELGRRLMLAAQRGSELGRLRAIARAEVGMGQRASDASLDSSLARGLLSTPLVGAPGASAENTDS